MKQFLAFLYLAVVHSAVSMAAVTINMKEVGDDVIATATGSLNLTGLARTERGSTVSYEGIFRGGLGFSQPGVVGALNGRIGVGKANGSIDEYVIETTHTFSLGILWVSQSDTGSHVGIGSRSDLGDTLTVAQGYSSGDPISSTSRWPQATLAAMKAVPGTYVFDWNMDSITLIIDGETAQTTYNLGGTITGLKGSVRLRHLGGTDLTRNANGSFTFGAALLDDSDYAVSIAIQPAGQTCTVSNGSGTIEGANVSNISVNCVTNAAEDNIFKGVLPSGASGALSFTSADEGCRFSGTPQFLAETSVTPAPPAGVSAIDGVVQFLITGCAMGATVTVSMDYGAPLPSGTTYWKAADPWYPLSNATVSGSVVTFSITDGGLGDADGLANGRIEDPSGAVLGAGTTGANAIPALSDLALVLLSLALGVFGVLQASAVRRNH